MKIESTASSLASQRGNNVGSFKSSHKFPNVDESPVCFIAARESAQLSFHPLIILPGTRRDPGQIKENRYTAYTPTVRN
jgi:hypothetical protein